MATETPAPHPASTSRWSDAAILEALAGWFGRGVDADDVPETLERFGARMRTALDAAHARHAAENVDRRYRAGQPTSVYLVRKYGGHTEKIGDWSTDPVDIHELQTRALTAVTDPGHWADGYITVEHGPGEPEYDEHTARVLAELDDLAARQAAPTCIGCGRRDSEAAAPECDGLADPMCPDCLNIHITGCGVCTQAEIDNRDAEDDR